MDSVGSAHFQEASTKERPLVRKAVPVSLQLPIWIARNFEELICAVVLAAMVGTVAVGVTWRYVLNSALPWPEELAAFLLVWLTFIGAALATKHRGHIVMDFAVNYLSARAKLWTALAVHFFVIAFLLMYVVLSWQVMQKMSVAVSPALSIRISYVYLALPLGGTLMIIHMTRQTIDIAKELAGLRRR